MHDQAGGETAVRRRVRKRAVLLALLVVLLAALAILWTQRLPLARDFVERELRRRDVTATYDITRIGFRTQRLENVVIGDPRNPDLTARWAEVITRVRLGIPRVTGVRAGGVRLNGRLVDGVFTFGQVDRLLPPPTGKPFTFPDLDLRLSDAQALLALPGGNVRVGLEGQGNLTGGFAGKLAGVAPALAVGDCRLSGATALLDLTIAERSPRVRGPVRAAGFACSGDGPAIAAPRLIVDARLAEALNRWDGSARMAAGEARLGANRLLRASGTIGFAGSAARTRGNLDIAAEAVATPQLSGRGLRLEGAYRLDRGGQLVAAIGGKAALAQAALSPATLANLTGFGAAADGTPLGPLARQLADAIRRAGRQASLAADFTFAQSGTAGSLQLAQLNAASASGARLALTGPGLAIAWPNAAGAQVEGELALQGGGFPQTRVSLAQRGPGGPLTGTATIAPYAASDARLALTPVRFSASGDATRFDTRVTLDGPLADGRVRGLTLPVSGRIGGGTVSINPGCAPLGFARLDVSGLVLGQHRLRLCPFGGPAMIASGPRGLSGGVRLASPRLAGRLGGTPVTIAAADARYALGDSALAASALALRLGAGDAITRLDVASLSGRGANGGLAGRFAGLGGEIANVPLIVSDSAGGWTFRGGALALDGGLRLTDADPNPRFAPLVSDDFTLRLADGDIDATGNLRFPGNNTRVARIDIDHDLSAGAGEAILDVSDLRFGPGFQPDQLTRFALGVVANVQASVSGTGTIRWTPDGVTSSGVFRTSNADFAAAFGPVTSASTAIRFTDLLGLESAPNQRITLGAVNPGLAVINGYIDYQLLPGQRVRIEGGRWPFAGGELTLDPAILDLGVSTERRLTFRVNGMDLAQFVTELDVKDVNMSGTMDGALPLVFDANGGRIEGGRLVARPGGGTLAYVGEVSNAELGIWGDIAFDALKSIAFQNLTIGLDGDLDGEIVSRINFDGVSRGTIEPVATGLIAAIGGQVANQLQRLPFRFNIRIQAPFRQLLGTARGLYDPQVLIERNLPELLRRQRERQGAPPVQPPLSEDRR